jgi:osmoprotectant transport system ATP-binding protein
MDKKSKKMEGIVKPKSISKAKDRTINVEDIMIREFAFVGPEDSVIEILKAIEENNISEIPVIDNQGILIGLITQSTLITTLSEQYLEEEAE